MVRYTVHFAGHVQGVGFRYTARNIAHGYTVAGYVQNLDDDRVLLVAEGEPDQLDALVVEVCQVMADYVHDKTVSRSPATGEFGTPGLGMLRIRH